jgi:ribosome-associated protein
MAARRRRRGGTPIKGTLSLVVSAAQDKKAEDIRILDLTTLGSITDYFIVCSGHSSRQTQAIADRVQEVLKEAGVRPGHVEGYQAGEWILMDYVDFVVHIFTEEKRAYYSLEKLWSDAPRVSPQKAARRAGGDRQEGDS